MRKLLLFLILPFQLAAQNTHHFLVELKQSYRPSMDYGGCTPGIYGSNIQCRGYGIRDVVINFDLECERAGATGVDIHHKALVCTYRRNDNYYYLETDASKELKVISVSDLNPPGKHQVGGERFDVAITLFYEHHAISYPKRLHFSNGQFEEDNYPFNLMFTEKEANLSEEVQSYLLEHPAAIECKVELTGYTGTCADCDYIGKYLMGDIKKPEANSSPTPASTGVGPGNSNTAQSNNTTAATSSHSVKSNTRHAANKSSSAGSEAGNTTISGGYVTRQITTRSGKRQTVVNTPAQNVAQANASHRNSFYNADLVAYFRNTRKISLGKFRIVNNSSQNVVITIFHPDGPDSYFASNAISSHSAGNFKTDANGEVAIGNDWGVRIENSEHSASEIYFLGELIAEPKDGVFTLMLNDALVRKYTVIRPEPGLKSD